MNEKFYGVELNKTQYQNLSRKLELLKEKCPAKSAISFSLDRRQDNYVAQMSVKSLSKYFFSRKIAHDPIQAFLLIEEDMEKQLLDWKRKRFSKKLETTLRPMESIPA